MKKIILTILLINSTFITSAFGVTFPFTDVSTSDWYYNDVETAYNDGLINGMTDTTFEPDSFITCGQAVKLAACMHQKYTIGSIILTNGTNNWWDNYVYYAKAFNIISKDYYWEHHATRAECAEIFANALPNEAMGQKNDIKDNSIPDVSMANSQAAAIYKLYRAGVLAGTDDKGTFYPNNFIKRSEISAILTRMMNKNSRKNFSLNTNIDNTPKTVYIINFNSMGGTPVTEEKIKEGEKAYWPKGSSKEGYQFAGWFIDSHLSKAYNFDNPVTSDLTLYAKWIKK